MSWRGVCEPHLYLARPNRSQSGHWAAQAECIACTAGAPAKPPKQLSCPNLVLVLKPAELAKVEEKL